MKTNILCLFAAVLSGAGSLLANDMDQNLVARWTFKDGSLKSDVGDYELQEGGMGTLDSENGTVTLRDRKFLFCPEISSAALPELRGSVTIWARVKLDVLPKEGELGVLGLQEGQEAGTWPSIVFAALYRPMAADPAHAGMAFLSRPQEAREVGVGERRFQPVPGGEFFNIAIVFNGQGAVVGMWVSSTGQFVESKLLETRLLQEFGALMLGKLITPGAVTPVTFDEVRIYSTALDARWLEEITAVDEK